jgi:hypothetical protein
MRPTSRRVSRNGTAARRSDTGRGASARPASQRSDPGEPPEQGAASVDLPTDATPTGSEPALELRGPAAPSSPFAPPAAAPAAPAPAPAAPPARPAAAAAAPAAPRSRPTENRDSGKQTARESGKQPSRGREKAVTSRESARSGRDKATRAGGRTTGRDHGKSSRVAAAEGEHKGSSRRVSAKKVLGGNRVMIIVGGVLLLAIIVALSWKPFERSSKLGVMEAAKKDPARMDAALAASDEWLVLADHDPARVQNLVLNNRAPVPVEVHLAQVMEMFPLLVSIAESTSISPEDRALAVHTAASIYNADKFGSERLPGGMDDWVSDANGSDAVAAAALELIGKADRDDAVPTLMRVAITPDSHPARADAAITALAGLVDARTCGQALAIFQGAGEARALANAAFCDAIAHNCGSELDKLLDLAFGKDPKTQAFALTCLGHCMLSDQTSNDARRTALADKLRPLIDAKTAPDALAGAIHAAASLQLSPLADQFIALGPGIDALALPQGTTSDALAHALGERFILTATDASKALTTKVVASLGTALGTPETRPVAVKALQLITSDQVPGLRAVLDQLAAAGDQPSVACLKTLLDKAYSRTDVVQLCGDDAAAWQRTLASEHTVSDRYNELKTWYKDNSKYHVIADGTARLQESVTYLEAATADTTKWLNDTSWVPPLGATRAEVESFHRDLNQLKGDVKRGLVGSQQHGDAPDAGAAATPAPADAPAPAPAAQP